MHCYNHPETPAIGICKACQRGLCHACAHDLGHGLACKDRHEKEVNTLTRLVQDSEKIYASAPKNALIAPVFYSFMGLVFAGFGLTEDNPMRPFMLLLGSGFLAFAVVIFLRSRTLYRKNQKDNESS